MRARVSIVLAALLSLPAVGCGGNPVGFFREDAFYHLRGHYRIRYEPASGSEPRQLLPAEHWTLENFVHDGQGSPLRVSQSEQFWTVYSLDLGGSRPQRVRAELYDLRFVHRDDGTVLFARTVPLPQTQDQTSLQVLARDYVERTASGSAMTVDFSTQPSGGASAAEARARRFGPRMLHEGPAEVDGQPAYYVVFEHIDLDRREAEPDARGEIITLVFVRPGTMRWRSGVIEGSEWPMVLMFGYASRPEHHEEHRAALESLIRRVDLRRGDDRTDP